MSSKIDWKGAARHFRDRAVAESECRIKVSQLHWAEHQQKVALVNAMSELLPRIVEGGGYCCKACWTVRGHADDCPYIAALAAIRNATKGADA